MQMFGASIYLSKRILVADLLAALQRQAPALVTPSVQATIEQTPSASFPFVIELDGLAKPINRWQSLYRVVQHISAVHRLTAAVEYQHREQPDNPYYSLLFDHGDIALGDDSQWEQTGQITIIAAHFELPPPENTDP